MHDVTVSLTRRTNRTFLKKTLLSIARYYAPIKTGNLKYNGIIAKDIPKGFSIIWDDGFVHYMDFVNNGAGKMTPKKRKNLHFIEKGVSSCLSYINYYIKNDGKVPHKLSIGSGKNKKVFRENYLTKEWGYYNETKTLKNYEDKRYKNILKKFGVKKSYECKPFIDLIKIDSSENIKVSFFEKNGSPYVLDLPKSVSDIKMTTTGGSSIYQMLKNAYKSIIVGGIRNIIEDENEED